MDGREGCHGGLAEALRQPSSREEAPGWLGACRNVGVLWM